MSEQLALTRKGFGFVRMRDEPLFLVSAGVSAKEALSYASDLLDAADRICGGLDRHLDPTEQGQSEAVQYLIEAAKAVVDAAVSGIAAEEKCALRRAGEGR